MLCVLIFAAPARAGFTVYTDRPTWEAAVGTIIQVEDLESEPGAPFSTITTPASTVAGWTLNSVNATITVQILDPGSVDGTRNYHCRDFGEKLLLGFPNGEAQEAFGFDFSEQSIESWTVEVDSTVIYTLPNVAVARRKGDCRRQGKREGPEQKASQLSHDLL